MACPTMIQVTNISPRATQQHMKELFSYLGTVTESKIYPEDDLRPDIPSKVCFVNFSDETSVRTALHLTNTIFIDRALIVAKSRYPAIPDEESAMSLAAPAVAIANQSKPVGHTAPLLPTPPTVTSVLGAAGIVPTNPPVPQLPTPSPLISLMGSVVPQPPPLTGNVDPTKIEEIRRTIYVGNLNSSLTAEQVLTFFQPCGEIKYVRMAGDETQPTRFAFVEFAMPESVPIALQYNGAMFGDRPIKVNHSKNAIVKPQGPSPSETKREVEEALRKVREANLALLTQVETKPVVEAEPPPRTSQPKEAPPPRKKSRSRSRSRSRTRSRDRRRNRSGSRDRYRKRSRSRSPFYSRRRTTWRSRSRSPYYRRRRSRSRSPRRHRDYRRRSRSRSRSPYERRRERRRSREREREREGRRERRRSPRRRSVSSSPERERTPKKSRSSRKDRSPSRSPSPSPKRSSKKSKKRRHKRRSPTPSLSPSPERSPSPGRSPSPPPRRRKGKEKDRSNGEDEGSNRESSIAGSPSAAERGSSDGGRGSEGEGSEMEEEERGEEMSNDGSGSPEKNDTDSSYD